MPNPADKTPPAPYRQQGSRRRFVRETRRDIPSQDGLYDTRLVNEEGLDGDDESRNDNRHPRTVASGAWQARDVRDQDFEFASRARVGF